MKITASLEDSKASFVSGYGPRTVNLKYGSNSAVIKVKAENDSISLPGGLNIADNQNYWLRLAKKYKPNGSKIL